MDPGETGAFFTCVLVAYIVCWWYVTYKVIDVNQSQVVIIERFGKFSRILSPGLHFLSFFESPRPIYSKHLEIDPYSKKTFPVSFVTDYIDMREQILDVPPRNFITRDTVQLKLDALVFYRIVDPLSVYAVCNLPDALELLCVSSLRNIVASLTLDETFSSRASLNTILKRQLESDCARFGIVINRVCIEEVIIGDDIRTAMETQKQEERQRIATIITAGATRETAIIRSKGDAARRVLTAEGEKHAAIARATGKAQAKVVAAQGDAECFSLLQDALKGEYRAADYLYTIEYLSQWPSIVSGKGCSVTLLPERAFRRVVESQS